MNLRHSAAVLAAAAVIASAGPALAADPSPSAAVPDGLYGTSDPTYDGVWRQSTALIVQREQGVTPADEAVAWLVGQQCANGAFPAFRADTSKDCDASTEVDTNSTAAALQALDAVGGHDAAAKKALGWLKSVQNEDGGWGEDLRSYRDPGAWAGRGASTASQTGWALMALLAAGERDSRAVQRGVEWLVATQREDGTWDEPQFTGTGFPWDFSINYHLYRQVFPLTALGRYLHGEPFARAREA